MRLTFISDTHGRHEEIALPGGDILIHCGDFTKRGEVYTVQSFADYLGKQNYRHKIVIAGNHDFSFENEYKEEVESMLLKNGIIYLNDSGINIDGLNFWGSPVQPRFFDWAFNCDRGEAIKKHWDLIPSNTDILITHGPPFGILDRIQKGEHVGCEDLLNAVLQIKPKIHAFGHIHEAYGIQEKLGIIFVNASSLDLSYQVTHKAVNLLL